jgi:PAS domain S-box-containing protein
VSREDRSLLSPILLLAQEVDTADRAVIATDTHGVVIYWGAGAEKLFGWTRDEVMGRRILEITPTDISRDEAEVIMKTLSGGHPWSGEFVLQTKAGKRFTAYVTDVPVHDSAGSLVGIVGISRAITYTGGESEEA